MLKLVIDNREHDFIELFKNNEILIEKENLEIGDFHIYYNNILKIIIERKTLSDLSYSIKDGRYKEQKIRLLHSIDTNIKKIYIIEGNNIKDFTLPNSTLHSVITNLSLRDGFIVIQTQNINNTIEYINNIIKNCPKYINNIVDTENIKNNFIYKTCKKNNINSKICFENMLKQIPGISNKISTILSNKYENMYSFINNVSNNKETFISTISEIKSDNRKIGNKTAENIYNFIFQ